jgi:hypothetical protein
MRRIAPLFVAAVLLLLSALPAHADRRVALVIGNGAYKEGPLKNPVHDARDMAAALRSLGFDVILRENASLRQMEDALDEFWRRLKAGGTGLFFFAGHGMQVKGVNYLVPVDARIAVEQDVRSLCLDANRVLGRMEDAGNGLNLVLLDACRNNPFARAWRSADAGLAKMDAPTGTLIGYATAPDSVAADGNGRNGVYTSNLLRVMRTPGLKVEDVMKQVRIGVLNETGRRQTPWESSSLTGDFYFAGSGTSAPAMPPQLALAVPLKAATVSPSPAAWPAERPLLSGTYSRVLDEVRKNDYAITFSSSGGALAASVSGGSNTSGVWPKALSNVSQKGDTLSFRLHFARGLFGTGASRFADVTCDLSAGADDLPCTVRNDDGEKYRQTLVRLPATASEAATGQHPAPALLDLRSRLVGRFDFHQFYDWDKAFHPNGVSVEFAMNGSELAGTPSCTINAPISSTIDIVNLRMEDDRFRFRLNFKRGLFGMGGLGYWDFDCDVSGDLNAIPCTARADTNFIAASGYSLTGRLVRQTAPGSPASAPAPMKR